MLKIIYGDLMDAKEDIIGHQVNCKGVMGSGVALGIRKKFPEAYNAFLSLGADDNNLGRMQTVFIPNKRKVIANLFGQKAFGKNGKFTDYDGLGTALHELAGFARMHDLSVALPYKIGAGLGGGDWGIIEQMILFEFSDVPITLYCLKQ